MLPSGNDQSLSRDAASALSWVSYRHAARVNALRCLPKSSDRPASYNGRLSGTGWAARQVPVSGTTEHGACVIDDTGQTQNWFPPQTLAPLKASHPRRR